jgi:hypothetical protein
MPFGNRRSSPSGETVPILPPSFPDRHHHPGLFSSEPPVPVRATSSHSGSFQMQDRQTERVQVDGEDLYDGVAISSLDPRSYDKIRQNFKCPKFTGQARDWKIWDKGFWRYLSIWELEYVLDPSFFDVIPLSADRKRDNKLVYFIIEDSV